MSYTINSGGIKSWAEDDRPREKMLLKGKNSLSDAELLAILIGMGTKEHSAVDLGRLILSQVNNDLYKLAQLSVSELQKVKGIGEAKAVTIMAALELGRRRKEESKQKRYFITDSKSAYDYFRPYLLDLRHEEFWILCLSRKLEIVKCVRVSTGGISGTVVDPKIVFTHVVETLCSAIILCHNHPSGTLKPSQEDIKLTEKLANAAKLMDVSIADHIIFTNDAYYSFADEQML